MAAPAKAKGFQKPHDRQLLSIKRNEWTDDDLEFWHHSNVIKMGRLNAKKSHFRARLLQLKQAEKGQSQR